MHQLDTWKNAFYRSVIVASGKVNEAKVLKWIDAVANPRTDVRDFNESSSEFVTLDAKLALALMKKLHGEQLRRIALIERQCIKQEGRLLTGRNILWFIYKDLSMNADMSLCYSIADLNSVVWMGDKDMERFRTEWENCVQNLAVRISDTNLASILLVQMQQSQKLKPGVDKWMAYPQGHRKKTYQRLLNMINLHLYVQMQRNNREAYEKHRSSFTAAPAFTNARKGQAKKPGAKGRGKGGRSPQGSRSASRNGSRSSSRFSGRSSGSRSSAGSGRSQGSNQSKVSSSAPGRGKCALYQIGKCTRSNCRFRHEKATAEEMKELQPAIERAQARSREGGNAQGGKKPCNLWRETGTCRFGAKCRFSHAASDHQTMSAMTSPATAQKAANKKKNRRKKSKKAQSSGGSQSSNKSGDTGSGSKRGRSPGRKKNNGNARSQTPGVGKGRRPQSAEAPLQRGSSAEKQNQ